MAPSLFGVHRAHPRAAVDEVEVFLRAGFDLLVDAHRQRLLEERLRLRVVTAEEVRVAGVVHVHRDAVVERDRGRERLRGFVVVVRAEVREAEARVREGVVRRELHGASEVFLRGVELLRVRVLAAEEREAVDVFGVRREPLAERGGRGLGVVGRRDDVGVATGPDVSLRRRRLVRAERAAAIAAAVELLRVEERLRAAVAAVELVEQQVDDRPGDRDVEPHPVREPRDLLVLGELVFVRAPDRHDDERQVHHGEDGVGQQNREVDGADRALALELRGPVVVVVRQVAREEERRQAQRGDHDVLVCVAAALLDEDEARDQEDRDDRVDASVEVREIGDRHERSPSTCNPRCLDHNGPRFATTLAQASDRPLRARPQPRP